MFKKFFDRLRFRALARQLRKPGGRFGNRVGEMMNRANEPLYHFTLGLLNPSYYERILEIGFGNGKFFGLLSGMAEGLELHGIDYSPSMVAEAAHNNGPLVQTGTLRLASGSSDALPYPNDHFDKIFCINVGYFWDNPVAHLQEIRRVLKPGGKVFVTMRTVKSMERMPFTRYGFNKYSPEDWQAFVEKAGMEMTARELFVEPASDFQPGAALFESVCYVSAKPASGQS
jgi:SAM-dependent methyltransferase